MRNATFEPKNLGRELAQIAGLAVFSGDRAARSLALLLAAARAGGLPILVLDGGNRFDPYLLSSLARLSGVDPDPLLSRTFASRAFTCHQLARLVERGLSQALRRYRPAVVVGLDLDFTFHEPQVPRGEALRLWRTVLEGVARAAETLPVLVSALPPPGGRPELIRSLGEAAAYRFLLTREEGAIRIVRERPEPGCWLWSPDGPDL